jgi:hypothetical protein
LYNSEHEDARTLATTLGTSEARKKLPELVREASSTRDPGSSLKDNAVEIKTRGQTGSASLIPTAALDAAEARIAELEEDLEDAGIALLVLDRLQSTTGNRLTAAEFLRDIGMEEFVAELPERR